jgi:hypothetical protein
MSCFHLLSLGSSGPIDVNKCWLYGMCELSTSSFSYVLIVIREIECEGQNMVRIIKKNQYKWIHIYKV